MQFIVFDLEATCWEGNLMGRQQEIIEIGAIRMDAYGHRKGTFQRFVKPVKSPSLSVYCKKLTGITQQDIDTALQFKYAGAQFRDWILSTDED
jgi:inhibitor of KinA sporulation pathway (predicted exonuclease)